MDKTPPVNATLEEGLQINKEWKMAFFKAIRDDLPQRGRLLVKQEIPSVTPSPFLVSSKQIP